MGQILTSISGLPISAASAGFAPTNSADVSAIASGYQVVSSTATQLYAGTAYLTSVNDAPVSASRAGNAANASLANSAYYDGTGRLISSLPDETTVSSIASSYAESAASSKADESALSGYYTTANESGFLTGLPTDISVRDLIASRRVRATTAGQDLYGNFDYAGMYFRSGSQRPYNIGIDNTGTNFYIATAKNGFERIYASSIQSWNGKLDSSASSSFYTTANESGFVDSAYVDSAVSGKADSSALSSYALSSDVSGVIDTVSSNSASWGGGATGDYVEKSSTEVTIGSSNRASYTSFAQGTGNSAFTNSFTQGRDNSAEHRSFAQGYYNSALYDSFAQGYVNSAIGTSFAQGTGNSATSISFAHGCSNTASLLSFAQGRNVSARSAAAVFGNYNLKGNGDTATGDSAAFAIGDGTAGNARHDLMLVTKDGEITMYSSTADTVGTGIMSSIRAISAAATGGGVDSATVSAIASSYAESAVSSKLDESATADFYSTSNPSSFVDSAYVDSAVSSKADSSALSSYALSADVSGTVDLVSSQSANWGGSALALSAGAGISLTLVGNTLVISTAGV